MDEAPSGDPRELRQAARRWLIESEPARKAAGVEALAAAWAAGTLTLAPELALQPVAGIPGRPARPELVPPQTLLKRSMRTVEGRAALLHALGHIEFNAINLALDAIWRFAGLPPDYYGDWLRVAAEEALHFTLLAAQIERLGFRYGDFPAHNALWDMAERTRDDVLGRIALVPRTLEARGLDATPHVRAKLAQAGEPAAAAVLDRILSDEIGHVAVGNRWFAWLCERRGLDRIAAYAELCRRYGGPQLRPPFNLAARRAAGFTEAELQVLEK